LTLRARARQVFDIGIYVVVVAVVVQFFLAGLGIFVSAELFFWHTFVNALVIGIGSLALAGVGWYARVDRRTVLITASMFGLVVLQSLLLAPYHMAAEGPIRAVAALHAVNAVFIFWVALQLLDRVRYPRGLAHTIPPTPARGAVERRV
jgi:hypothetical protein